MDVYARDVLGAPLHALASLLGKIRIGSFWPDATRSGRWLDTGEEVEPTAALDERVQALPRAPDAEEQKDSSSGDQENSSSSESSDSGKEVDTEAAARSIFKGLDPYPPMPEGGVWFGSRRGTIHRGMGESVPKAACGYGL